MATEELHWDVTGEMRQPLVVRKWDQQGSGRAHHEGRLKHDKRVMLVIHAQYMPCFVLDFVLAGRLSY